MQAPEVTKSSKEGSHSARPKFTIPSYQAFAGEWPALGVSNHGKKHRASIFDRSIPTTTKDQSQTHVTATEDSAKENTETSKPEAPPKRRGARQRWRPLKVEPVENDKQKQSRDTRLFNRRNNVPIANTEVKNGEKKKEDSKKSEGRKEGNGSNPPRKVSNYTGDRKMNGSYGFSEDNDSDMQHYMPLHYYLPTSTTCQYLPVASASDPPAPAVRASDPPAFRASDPPRFRASDPPAFRASHPPAFRASDPAAVSASVPPKMDIKNATLPSKMKAPFYTSDYWQQHTFLRQSVMKQIEYYLCAENLQRDFFLRRKMDLAGFVPVHTLANFPKMREISKDFEEILQAVKESAVLEVAYDPVKGFVVRTRFNPEIWPIHDALSAQFHFEVPPRNSDAPAPDSGVQEIGCREGSQQMTESAPGTMENKEENPKAKEDKLPFKFDEELDQRKKMEEPDERQGPS